MEELASKLFKKNKYTKWYFNLIESRNKLNRKKELGLQEHHIIPKSLGGNNRKINKIILTPREHYICHLLLLEMTDGINKSKMYYAFLRFKSSEYTSSRSYEKFIKLYSKSVCGEYNHFFGKKHSDKTKKKISENHGMKNRYCYDIWLEKYGKIEADKLHKKMLNKRSISITENSGMRGKKHTKKTIEKMKNARKGQKPMLGKKHSDKTKLLYSETRKGNKNPNYGKKRAWINNGKINKCVLLEELKNYDGWFKGRI